MRPQYQIIVFLILVLASITMVSAQGRRTDNRVDDAAQARALPFRVDRLTPAKYVDGKAALQAEAARRAALDARTVDEYRPGEQQSEVDHGQKGVKTISGERQGGKYRHAEDGGWFSLNMKVTSGQPVELLCIYWGGESGNRTFDILVDGKVIATQSLQQDKPGELFDRTYAIPEELTRGKQTVEVRFQAHPGNFAGGLYGAKILRVRS